MLVDDIIFLSQEIKRLIAEEHVDGFVVVQGTDTIEETAFALNTLIDTPIPVVVTGAIRIPDMKGADGPANLLASIRVAASDNCRGLGTVVVFNDMIFPADYVRQIHTYVPNAFDAECGPLGFIAEGIPSLRVRPIIRRIPHIDIKTVAVKLVPIYTVSIGDDGKLLTAVKSLGYKGLVLEALGGGHVPTSLVFILEQLAKELPVILSSRIGCGDMLTSTFSGYPGSEISLLGRGLISSGFLNGRKARILLILLLMSGCTKTQIAESFKVFSKYYNG